MGVIEKERMQFGDPRIVFWKGIQIAVEYQLRTDPSEVKIYPDLESPLYLHEPVVVYQDNFSDRWVLIDLFSDRWEIRAKLTRFLDELYSYSPFSESEKISNENLRFAVGPGFTVKRRIEVSDEKLHDCLSSLEEERASQGLWYLVRPPIEEGMRVNSGRVAKEREWVYV